MTLFGKLTVWAFATLAVTAIAFAAGQNLPAGEGKSLIEGKCVQCHELAKTTDLKHTREEWADKVKMMQSYGAAISEAEFPVVVDYLAAHFGKTPASTPGDGSAAADAAQLPPGNGRGLVAVACTGCHDLSDVTGKKLSRAEWTEVVERMVGYGSSFDGDRLDELKSKLVVDYLSMHYAK